MCTVGGEYVASYVNNGHRHITEIGGTVGTTTDLKTKQVYPSTVTNGSDSQAENYNLAKDIYGDAVYETSTSLSGRNAWCSDSSSFPYSDAPFFGRGSNYNNSSAAGVFEFHEDFGGGGGLRRWVPPCALCGVWHLKYSLNLLSLSYILE